MANEGMTRSDVEWRPELVRPGDHLLATDAVGIEHECVATSEYEPPKRRRHKWDRGHLIRVSFPGKGGSVAWPAESLRPAGCP